MDEISWVEIVTKFANTGVAISAFWFLLVKYIPANETRHRDDRIVWLTEMKDTHAECEGKIIDLHERTVVSMREMTDKVSSAIDRVESRQRER